MKIPDETCTRLKNRLWAVADKLNWPTLSDPQKSALYEDWMRDGDIGGILSRYIAPGNVRVYIKDTIMKPYGRERIKEPGPVLTALSIPLTVDVSETYIKPHGRRLADGRVICWGLSRDWKAIVLAVFERAYLGPSATAYAAVIMYPAGKCRQPVYRRMIEIAAEKMGIQHLVWYDE